MLYQIDLTDGEWIEIRNLSSILFPILNREGESGLTRAEWRAIALMCLGKAHELLDDLEQGRILVEETDDVVEWAKELREIARKVQQTFQPGDGKF